MAKWYEITWFRDDFALEIYLKSGQTIKFPKGYFKEFNIERDGTGKIEKMNWKCYPGSGEPLAISIDDIVAIIGRK